MNIVFDLGGVVVNWQPDLIIRSVFGDTSTQDLVRKKIIEHADWIELDRGSIALQQAIERGAARTGLPANGCSMRYRHCSHRSKRPSS